MVIPVDVGFMPGDSVMVLNSNKKPGKWESGVVVDTEAHFYGDRHYVVYVVKLNRTTKNGKPMRIRADDASLVSKKKFEGR